MQDEKRERKEQNVRMDGLVRPISLSIFFLFLFILLTLTVALLADKQQYEIRAPALCKKDSDTLLALSFVVRFERSSLTSSIEEVHQERTTMSARIHSLRHTEHSDGVIKSVLYAHWLFVDHPTLPSIFRNMSQLGRIFSIFNRREEKSTRRNRISSCKSSDWLCRSHQSKGEDMSWPASY